MVCPRFRRGCAYLLCTCQNISTHFSYLQNDVQIRTKAENSWAEWDTYAEQIPSNSPVGWREGDDENTEVVIELSGPTFEESGISVVYQTSSGDGSAFCESPKVHA